MIHLRVALSQDEADALAKWAASQLRDPRDQIRYVIREALVRENLLQPAAEASSGKQMMDYEVGLIEDGENNEEAVNVTRA